MQLLIKYMHFVPERLKCCAWFTGLTVLINLSVLNKRGLVFILGSVSHCYGGSGFRGVWTKLRGWCSLDLLSVVRSPFCRHKKKKKKSPTTIRIVWCSGTPVINARRCNWAPLFASSVRSFASRETPLRAAGNVAVGICKSDGSESKI